MSNIVFIIMFIVACACVAGRWDMEDAKAAEASYCESVRTHQTPDYDRDYA